MGRIAGSSLVVAGFFIIFFFTGTLTVSRSIDGRRGRCHRSSSLSSRANAISSRSIVAVEEEMVVAAVTEAAAESEAAAAGTER